MKTIALTTLSILALSTAAHAQTSTLAVAAFSVPEIDPSMATAGLVLLTGTIAVLRGRKRA